MGMAGRLRHIFKITLKNNVIHLLNKQSTESILNLFIIVSLGYCNWNRLFMVHLAHYSEKETVEIE